MLIGSEKDSELSGELSAYPFETGNELFLNKNVNCSEKDSEQVNNHNT